MLSFSILWFKTYLFFLPFLSPFSSDAEECEKRGNPIPGDQVWITVSVLLDQKDSPNLGIFLAFSNGTRRGDRKTTEAVFVNI